MSIEGIAVDGSQIPNGRVQRATPRFSRPSIDLDSTARVRRDWRAVPVANIVAGDNVPGLGVITAVQSCVTYGDSGEAVWTVTLTGADGTTTRVFKGSDAVYAFTAEDTPA